MVRHKHFFAGTDNGVYVSTDEGATWTPRNTGLSSSITAILLSNTTLYAGSPNNGVYVSNDLGSSWKSSTTIIGGYANCFGVTGSNVYATGPNGVYRTSDNGANWLQAENGLGSDTAGYALSNSGGSMFLWTTPRNMYQWNDASSTWKRIFAGLQESGGLMCTVGSRLFLSTTTGIFISDDGGTTAHASNTGMIQVMNKLAVNGGALYAEHSGFIYTSTDQGASWSSERVNHYNDTTTIGYTAFSALTTDGANLLAASALYGIFRLTANATQVTFLVPYTQLFDQIVASGLAVSGSTIFASAANVFNVNTASHVGGVFYSTDNAQTFTQVNSGLQDTGVTALLAEGSTLYAATDDGGVYTSTNNGTGWTLISNVPSSFLTSLAINGGTMFGGSDVGVYVSVDHGAHWSLHNGGLSSVSIHGLALDAKYLYVSTDTGVWRGQIIDLLGVPESKQAMAWLQTFPNPSSGVATIRYNVPESGEVRFRIFDALGRLVWSNQSSTQPPGINSVEVNTLSWPKGCYNAVLSLQGDVVGRTKIIRE